MTVTVASLPIKALAEISESPTTPEVASSDLPQEPGTWGDSILEMEEELPQDPNVLLMDVDEIYKLYQSN